MAGAHDISHESTMAVAMLDHLARDAHFSRAIYKPWRCKNCGRAHPSEQLSCDWIRPVPSEDDVAGFRAVLAGAAA